MVQLFDILGRCPVIVTENNNTKSAAPPADPPPPPPADMGDSMDSQPDFSFNLELTRNQHEQYDTQFTAPPSMTPPVTIVGKYAAICLEDPNRGYTNLICHLID